ncbi:homoserine dehydrogenase [Marinicauda pacifica]|uniref:homoserine dehydrogenase n=1 Tax=Marinicauda pacifica TaxID=1133559 RepID=UPI0035C7C75F
MTTLFTLAPAASPVASSTGSIRAVMLGCGTVGSGVLLRLPRAIRLEALLVKDRTRARPTRAPVFTDIDDILSLRPELVIETLPGGEEAERALERAVAAGCHIVSANKDVCARRPDLEARTRQAGRTFAYAAAVGGGVPVLEAIAQLKAQGRQLTRARAVVNGTSNFVLDRLAAGQSLETAVTAAQEAGFAEADPGADLDGHDAACKLALMARTAWGVDLAPRTIPAQSLRDLDPVAPARAVENGCRIRQVASLRREGGTVTAEVRLETLSLDDPLSRTKDEANCVVLHAETGLPVVLSGKGAGKGPTAASMLGDIARLLGETC